MTVPSVVPPWSSPPWSPWSEPIEAPAPAAERLKPAIVRPLNRPRGCRGVRDTSRTTAGLINPKPCKHDCPPAQGALSPTHTPCTIETLPPAHGLSRTILGDLRGLSAINPGLPRFTLRCLNRRHWPPRTLRHPRRSMAAAPEENPNPRPHRQPPRPTRSRRHAHQGPPRVGRRMARARPLPRGPPGTTTDRAPRRRRAAGPPLHARPRRPRTRDPPRHAHRAGV